MKLQRLLALIPQYWPVFAAEEKHRGLQSDPAKQCSTHKTWTGEKGASGGGRCHWARGVGYQEKESPGVSGHC
eukprot:1153930-Pelagomonas_calceolata.AAC.2